MSNTTIKYLNEKETHALYKKVNNDIMRHSERNQAIFYIAKYCALRISEVGMLRIDDYEAELSQIYCKRQKGSLNNTIRIIDPVVKEKLDIYYKSRLEMEIDSPFLFISQQGKPVSRKLLDHLIKRYCKNTPIPKEKRHFHVLKHTRAIELGNIGADIKEMQWWLGHKNINNTLIYMQFTTTQQESLYEKLLKEINYETD